MGGSLAGMTQPLWLMRKFPLWPMALLGLLCNVDLEEHPGAREAHSPGSFLSIGPVLTSGTADSSTLVAVPVFLLLTSLTYLVFKLSPSSVAKVRVSVYTCVIVLVCLCMRFCMSVNVYVCESVCACVGVR